MTTKNYDYCSDCKNFYQHYVNIKNVGIRKTACGHCVGHKIKYGCEFYEKSNNIETNNELEIINLLISTKNYLQYFIHNLEQLEIELKNQNKTK